MVRKISASVVFNRRNKQINISLPKKKISKEFVKGLEKAKRVDIDLLKFYSD